MLFRFSKMREGQEEFVRDLVEAFRDGKIFLAHAPTGMGKTDASISAALTVALELGLKVVFLTPKISQHSLALKVVGGINRVYDLREKALDIVGKKYLCIHPLLSNVDDVDNFQSACKRLKSSEKCVFYKNALGLGSLAKMAKGKALSVLEREVVVPHTTVYEVAKANELCPYELALDYSRDAQVFIADYYHLFIPSIRYAVLSKIKLDLDKAILIVDEAHNLPERIRKFLSSTINEGVLKKAEKEAKLLGRRINLAGEFREVFKPLSTSSEVLVGKEALEEAWGDLESLEEELEEIGEEYIESTAMKSYSLKVAKFLKIWLEDGFYVRILKKHSKGFSLSVKALDISPATEIIKEFHSSLLMSGTLRPLQMFKDILGIPDDRAVLKEYKSPFPESNRMAVIVKGLTTKFSKRTEEMFVSYAREIDRVYENSPKGVAVFFPSFKVLNAVVPFLKSRPIYVQKENSKPSEVLSLISAFKQNPGLLVGVQGGSISEGVDFNNGEIKTVIIGGIALEELTLEKEALIDFYEMRFGKGMEYGYFYPAIIKALQAVGRAIRKEDDRAFFIFMDDRFAWKNYRRLLGFRNIPVVDDPIPYLKAFFSEKSETTSM